MYCIITANLKLLLNNSGGQNRMNNRKTRSTLVMLLIITMVATLALSACGKKNEEPKVPPHNPFTGAYAEDGFDTSALERRNVAFVVENAPDARPQWGMDDPEYSPDMVLQGEVEGGITRMLWFYADDTKLPEVIGPTRSARPPFVKFSTLFDAIFIHWGMSHTTDNYIGADKMFDWYDIDHIDQMYLDDVEGMYGRDDTRAVNVEHTGIIYGSKVPATIKNEGLRTTPNDYTKFYFNDEPGPVSEDPATTVNVRYSEIALEGSTWKYNEEDEMYHTSDFENDFARDNLLVLIDNTEYVTKDDYGLGGSVTYCNYDLKGGKAKLYSKGTVKEIEWTVDGDYLILKDPSVDIEEAKKDKDSKAIIITPEPEEGEDSEDAEARAYAVQTLNKGKTWIGWISGNNGGYVSES